VGDAFARYTIASYVANFDTYSGQRFEVAPVVRAAGSDRIVETQIAAASAQGYVLDYVMRQESGGWKVVDVLVDGAISTTRALRPGKSRHLSVTMRRPEEPMPRQEDRLPICRDVSASKGDTAPGSLTR
jgi:hypothetical protein